MSKIKRWWPKVLTGLFFLQILGVTLFSFLGENFISQTTQKQKDLFEIEEIGRTIEEDGPFRMNHNLPHRFDSFLKGETEILSDSEYHGLEVFVQKGCVYCHQGVNLGGNLTVQNPQTKKNIRVPGLRSSKLRSSQIHLKIKEMVKTYLRKELQETEIKSILAFLESFKEQKK